MEPDSADKKLSAGTGSILSCLREEPANETVEIERDNENAGNGERGRAVARQGEQRKKHGKDWLPDVCALVNRRFKILNRN